MAEQPLLFHRLLWGMGSLPHVGSQLLRPGALSLTRSICLIHSEEMGCFFSPDLLCGPSIVWPGVGGPGLWDRSR